MKPRGVPIRRTPLKRVAFRPKRKVRDNEFSPEVRRQIGVRCAGRCEARTPVCEGPAEHIHHVRPRSHGGMGTIDNGLAVCRYCHGYIHNHPLISLQHGWLARS